MKIVNIIILCLSFLGTSVSFAQVTKVNERDLEVAVGIDEVIKLDYQFSTKVQIGNESILNLIISPKKREITFRGKNAGKTSVTIRDNTGDIRDKIIVNITASGKSSTVRELRQLIGQIEGIEIGIKGGQVIVEGELIVPGDVGRIAKVLGKYPDVLQLIELSPQTQRVIARKMQEEINRNDMKDVTVRIVNGDFWIEGVVNSGSKKKIAQEIADQYVPDQLESLAKQSGGRGVKIRDKYMVINFLSVNEKKDPAPPAKLVKVTTQFVELTKDYQKTFAFKWSPLMTNDGSISFGKTSEGGVTTEENNTLSGTISSLFPKLSSAKSAGYARVIQSAMMIVKDGTQGSVNKTTSQDYSIGTAENAGKGTAKTSISLSVTPKIGDKESIELNNLSISVSLPSGKTANGAPIPTTNTVNTTVTVKSKESAVIAGVVQNASNTAYDKDDPTGSAEASASDGATALFNLLRSKSYNNIKSQFVIFVTPEIVESASAGSEEIRRKFKKRSR